jgi:hypothetical protein
MRKREWSRARRESGRGRRSRALGGEAVAGSRGGGVLYVSRQYERETVSPCLKSSGLCVREGSCWERETGVQVGELPELEAPVSQPCAKLLEFVWTKETAARVFQVHLLLSQHDQGSENLVTT